MNANPKTTVDDLFSLLRSCPAEQIPDTPDSATTKDPPDSSIVNRQSAIGNTTALGTPRAPLRAGFSQPSQWSQRSQLSQGTYNER